MKNIASLTGGYHEEKYVFDETLFYTFFNFFLPPQTSNKSTEIHEIMKRCPN
jgi:hypothetical protein